MKERSVFVTLMVALLASSLPVVAQDKAVSGQEVAKTPAAPALKERPLSVLLYFGLYTQWYRIEESLEPLAGHKIKVANARTDGADFFPAAEEFPALDVIVLSDVNYESIKDLGLQITDAFVKRGGGLLVLGGPFTYGEGDYEESILPDMLPVEMAGPFDIKWEKEGLPFVSATSHPILEGVDLSAAPQIYWIHEARPKPSANVVLKAGDRPLLVLGTRGKGRVAAFLGTPMGKAPEGKLPFWQWKQWDKLMRNTLIWLAGTKKAVVLKEALEYKKVLVYSEDFDKVPAGKTLHDLGWKVNNPKGALFEITPEHNLKITHTTIDYCGDHITHPVRRPLRKGILEFDVNLGAERSGWFSLQVNIAGKNAPFSNGKWLAYESSPDYASENRWTAVGKVPLGQWHTCAVEFDFESEFPTMKFFVDGNHTGTASAEKGFTEFKAIDFRDYGLCSAPVVNYVDNIKLYELVPVRK